MLMLTALEEASKRVKTGIQDMKHKSFLKHVFYFLIFDIEYTRRVPIYPCFVAF